MRKQQLLERDDLSWLKDVKPYVFLREENRVKRPGQRLMCDWFERDPVFKNALKISNLSFANQILNLEGRAFSSSNMAMPRWVFYDCAVMPGFVAGFALPKAKASQKLIDLMGPEPDNEWVPISLFIVIPTMGEGEWVAHNLCSVNALLPRSERYYGLGFLTKAFGLWYANIDICCGMTQWGSPSIKLHSHYGKFEILTAYTPVHSYPRTLTYRVKVDTEEWARFFTSEPCPSFSQSYERLPFQVNPQADQSLLELQARIEQNEGPFYLDSNEIRSQGLDQPLYLYRIRRSA